MPFPFTIRHHSPFQSVRYGKCAAVIYMLYLKLYCSKIQTNTHTRTSHTRTFARKSCERAHERNIESVVSAFQRDAKYSNANNTTRLENWDLKQEMSSSKLFPLLWWHFRFLFIFVLSSVCTHTPALIHSSVPFFLRRQISTIEWNCFIYYILLCA